MVSYLCCISGFLLIFSGISPTSVRKRLNLLSKWQAKGGVLLMGYVQFRKLLLGKSVRDRDVAVQIFNFLQVNFYVL
jgi:hypothetical protein